MCTVVVVEVDVSCACAQSVLLVLSVGLVFGVVFRLVRSGTDKILS